MKFASYFAVTLTIILKLIQSQSLIQLLLWVGISITDP